MRTLLLSTLSLFPLMAQAEIKAVASFSILGDMVAQVGGDKVEVTTIVDADQDAHIYRPSIADARAVAAADVIFLNGLGFETWAADLIASASSGAPQITVTDLLPLDLHGEEDEEHHDEDGHYDHGEGEHHDEDGHDDHDDEEHHDEDVHDDHDYEEHHDEDGHDDHVDEEHHDDHDDEKEEFHAHDHGGADPHAWNALANAIGYIEAIEQGLIALDPENATYYTANADAYTAELEALRSFYLAQVATLPETHRTVITSHDAFGYLAEETGLTFLAPKGINTGAAATPGQVQELIEQIRELDKVALFAENITSTALVDQIAAETGAIVGGQLFSDALSGPMGPASTYVQMYAHNMDAIIAALQPE